MQLLFFPHPAGGAPELHRSGLIPDRQKNTNKINLCQLPPGAGMKEHNGTLPKQGREVEGGNKEKEKKKKKRHTKQKEKQQRRSIRADHHSSLSLE